MGQGMGGPEFDRGMDVVADASGSIYVTGTIADTVDMGWRARYGPAGDQRHVGQLPGEVRCAG